MKLKICSALLFALSLAGTGLPLTAEAQSDYGRGGYYDRDYDNIERNLDRERDALEDERRALNRERDRIADAQAVRPVEQCPSGFKPSENKCSDGERRKGCKDIRLPGGLGCVNR